jgi:hypothetical protein
MSSIAKQDIDLYRGEKKDVTWVIAGNWATYKLSFAVSLTKDLDNDLLILKNNVLNSGSDDELEASYSSSTGKTTITAHLLKADSGDFTQPLYYYDLIAVSASDSSIKIPLQKGDVILDLSVQSDYSNLSLPNTPPRYSSVLSYPPGDNAARELAKAILLTAGAEAGSYMFFDTQDNSPYWWNGSDFV